MALAPFARQRLIPPGENDPKITPRVGILHVDGANTPSLYEYFKSRSGGIESHFHVQLDGDIEQYRDTAYEADANWHANPFALSVETQGFGSGRWTLDQITSIKRLMLWARKVHDIPLRVVSTWDDSRGGWGYHTMFGAPGPWTPEAKSCPGAERIHQFHEVLVPWMREQNMAERRAKVRLRHTNVQTTDSRVLQKETVTETVLGADLVTFNEANDIQTFLPRHMAWFWQGDNAIGWRRRSYTALHRGSRLLMLGGHLGAGNDPQDHRRRGPNRYLIWVVLEHEDSGARVLVGCTHTIARAGSLAWRRALLWATLTLAGWVLKRKAKRYHVRNVILVGDLNWAKYVKIEGLRAVQTPATYGRHLHYDQIHVSEAVSVVEVSVFRTNSDHRGLDAELKIVA